MKKTILFVILLVSLSAYSQKKEISTSDFANWNRIENRMISNDGSYIAYELNPQKGDGKLIIRSLKIGMNDTLPLGYNAVFSPNSDFIAFKLKPAEDTLRKAKLAEVKKDLLPKDSMAVLNLKNHTLEKFPKLLSFSVPSEKASWVAIYTEFQEPVKDSASQDTLLKPATNKKTNGNKKKTEKERKDLLVVNPINQQRFHFPRVEEYNWSKNGKSLGIISKTDDSTKAFALLRFDTQTLLTDTIYKDTCTLKSITLDETGTQWAFLSSKDTVKEKVFSLQYGNLKTQKPLQIADTLTSGIHKGWAPSEFDPVYFSQDGTKLFLGTAPKPIHKPKDAVLEEDKPKLDLWSWTDNELQPVQLKNLDKEKKRTFLALYRVIEKKWVQLADSGLPNIQLINQNNGEWALASNPKPYQRQSSWEDRRPADYSLIDLKTGIRKEVLKAQSHVMISPTGRFVLYYQFEDSCYYAYDHKLNKTIPLTKELDVPFYDELNDMPTEPDPYGVAGWAEDDAFVLIYDRFDIWKIDPKGMVLPEQLTKGEGRKHKTRYRYLKLDKELVFIPNKKDLLLTGFNEDTYREGYYSTSLSSRLPPKELFSGDIQLGHEIKAKETSCLIWSQQTLQNYPEIQFSPLTFKNIQKISTANPQQDSFNWATVELVKWETATGDTLRGLLYKPENFNPGQKYPMLVYYYERNSEEIHRHILPYPSHSIINPTHYCSNGYLVFIPDIIYRNGYPGQSAYDAIMSGVNFLNETRNYIDIQRIGLQGQSWGGYQTAFLITRTPLFAAAMAGAPVSNMTSAYGGIRWESGMSRMFQYEHTQSRIGATLWEKPNLYIENSPLFYAPNITTPLLIMSNDNDGAVPWYQGIELFTALRRLDKPVWMLNYNGMGHNLEPKYWANRMDLTLRMMQFFDHYLKNKPAPGWMKNGIPAIEKGDKLGY
ncbi:MAG TPA: hypothetical protein DCQ26_07370 [Marinilabiliales bacterium]|jgi:dienelactone hydrolase|nr:MAG: hypothetical protein A2W95_06645 [Bacteroidetes bacterium GWA2_40_14]OFX58715.1 MAG: hypothetical protein A2W84_19320 [Bacteroidetes bacterium GWC2_40_13]OFX71852.1 MAG: hypothetical protein A2W96_06375 [Bacteroidetes bacterium GWD2_40_43]OFX94650.1 MAG: hypothetical protein A2W97_18180 [Bacteroidetes bacterium GWE2_40_63]OFY17951.1 MAG: hypothetical protein A2W88_16315 [Bacteroidetes bacterium GWF2_40_13]OFZ24415.1 MAG: hypothetical protein A2437_18310 [Bacteroidetes bacterium RIFOXYC